MKPVQVPAPETLSPPPVPDVALAVAEQLHELFLEYRDRHGCDEVTAWAKVVCEYLDARNAGPVG